MNLQDGLAIMTFTLAIATLVFAVGKQTQRLTYACEKLNQLSNKFDLDISALLNVINGFSDRSEKRLDYLAIQTAELKQRLVSVERHIYREREDVVTIAGIDFTDDIN